MSRKNIESVAEDVWRRSGGGVPVDVLAIAATEGIQVIHDDLRDNISGVLLAENSPFIIGVNQQHHPNRQRFSIAHELGHFFLHLDFSRLFIDAAPIFRRDEHSSDGLDEQEIEANAFAAALLMPQEAIFKYLHDHPTDPHDDVGIRRIAGRFGVSSQAMAIRLARLELV